MFWICAGDSIDTTEMFSELLSRLAQGQGLFCLSSHLTIKEAEGARVGKGHSQDI